MTLKTEKLTFIKQKNALQCSIGQYLPIHIKENKLKFPGTSRQQCSKKISSLYSCFFLIMGIKSKVETNLRMHIKKQRTLQKTLKVLKIEVHFMT